MKSFDEERCPDCGAQVSGGREGCQALFDALTARALNDPAYAALRDLALDTYCMQHPEKYCRSAKSYAAHLSRLCCGLEFGGDPRVYAAIQKWLNHPGSLAKPEVLPFFGHLTVTSVYQADSPQENLRRVRAWAEEVWTAYAPQQSLARDWVREALG